MSNWEIAAITGFARMGANCCQILEVFWYLDKSDVQKILITIKA